MWKRAKSVTLHRLSALMIGLGTVHAAHGQGANVRIAETGGSGVNTALPYVLAVVLVVVLLTVFGVLLAVVLVMHMHRARREADRLHRFEQERAEQQQRLDELQDRLAVTDRQAGERLSQEALEEAGGPSGGRTRVYGRPKLGLFLIDKHTGIAHTLALHLTNAEGHVTNAPKYRVGKLAECDICLPDSTVSRHHCDLYANYDGEVFVFDHNSPNGTFIQRGDNVIQVKGECRVLDQDLLILGDRRVGAASLKVMIEAFNA